MSNTTLTTDTTTAVKTVVSLLLPLSADCVVVVGAAVGAAVPEVQERYKCQNGGNVGQVRTANNYTHTYYIHAYEASYINTSTIYDCNCTKLRILIDTFFATLSAAMSQKRLNTSTLHCMQTMSLTICTPCMRNQIRAHGSCSGYTPMDCHRGSIVLLR